MVGFDFDATGIAHRGHHLRINLWAIVGTLWGAVMGLLLWASPLQKLLPLGVEVPIIVAALAIVSAGLTAILFACSGFRVRKQVALAVGGALSLGAWVIVSMWWTPSRIYAVQKTAEFFALSLWSMVSGAVACSVNEYCTRGFGASLLALSCVGTLRVLAGISIDPSLGISGLDYLVVGRLTGAGAVTLFCIALTERRRPVRRGAATAALVLFTAAMLVPGGRGPAVALAIVYMSPIVAWPRMGKRDAVDFRWYAGFLLLLGLGGVLGLMYFGAPKDNLKTIVRWLSHLEKAELGAVSSGRIDGYYLPTVVEWLKAPLFGRGIGSWPLVFGFGDALNYPHNIVLEFLFELGLVGCSMFLMIVATSLRSIVSVPNSVRSRDRAYLTLLFLFFGINSMLTADINGNFMVFCLLGMMRGVSNFRGASRRMESFDAQHIGLMVRRLDPCGAWDRVHRMPGCSRFSRQLRCCGYGVAFIQTTSTLGDLRRVPGYSMSAYRRMSEESPSSAEYLGPDDSGRLAY